MRCLRRTSTSASGFLRRRLLSALAGNGVPPPCSGVVFAFGDNSHGAAGQPAPASDVYVPTPVPSLPPSVAAITAGHYHSLAVSSEGEVWAWGRNDEGQLGRGHHAAPRNTWSKPEQVRGLENVQVRAVSASGVVSAAIGCDGSLWVWGRSKRGQLGLGKDVVEAAVPSRVEVLANYDIVKVSFGWGHAMALTKDGGLLGWGYSENGRLGEIGQITQAPSAKELLGKTVDKYSSSMLEAVEKMVEEKIRSEDNMPIIWEPSLVHEVSHVEVSDVSCGLDHSLVLRSDGIVLSGGDNTYGQLGRKSTWSKFLPVDTSHSPFSVSASVGHSLATCNISTEATDHAETGVLSWGWNCSSQLGRPGEEDAPVLVDGLNGEGSVSALAGRVHSVVLTSKGEVWAWGSGRNGRLGLGSSMDEPEPCLVDTLEGAKVSQVAAGMDHTLLLVAE
uniref:RCC1-like domain-containing protein n=1 Tax=Oryza punctata TaxID=4537 RepID=A0A0E0JWV1_ORYPU